MKVLLSNTFEYRNIYDSFTHTLSIIHISTTDIIVALKRAWDTGASSWSDEKRERFANDPINLLVVDDGTNQSKGAKSVLEWLPPNEAYHCNYATRYLRVLITYELKKSYQSKVRNLRQELCAK